MGMDDISAVGLLMFALLSMTFWLAGHAIKFFVGTFLGLLISLIVLVGQTGEYHAVDGILTIGGFICYFGGLLIVRAMLQRSVSLHLLLAAENGSPVEDMKLRIKERLGDMVRYKLAVEQNGVLRLTVWGQVVAGVTAFLYKVFGQNKE